jgi:deoxyribodipyrimidine photo-lyase
MADKRIRIHSPGKQTGKYILYWMQQAQRIEYNHALSYAISKAKRCGLPLVVLFVVSDDVPDANSRHYYFMLQGLWEVATALHKQGISFYFACGEVVEVVAAVAEDALEVVADHGYLRFQRQWRTELATKLSEQSTAYTEIETEAIVPVTQVSDKEEYSAATIRRKIVRLLPGVDLEPDTEVYKPVSIPNIRVNYPVYNVENTGFPSLWKWVNQHLKLDDSVAPVLAMQGGATAAKGKMHDFTMHKLALYQHQRNNPALDIQSGLSPYLHFGQISAMEIVQHILRNEGVSLGDLSLMLSNKRSVSPRYAGIASFAEELIIRRELSFNFCHYNPYYDTFSCLPAWAKATMLDHLPDIREEHYSLDRLEQCDTSDVYWNAAQMEMMQTGKMHNYMRMYWGKRLLAWCDSPEDAYQILLYLNNRYEQDGRDPNAYAGIAWCFGKHDRPWMNRKIYGMVRYMNAAGLERKYDMDAYLQKVTPDKR